LNKKDSLISKKLLTSYKERLEKEIINRSDKLRIPPHALKQIISNNNEIKELKNVIQKLENNSSSCNNSNS